MPGIPPIGMAPPVSMAMGPRMPMMVNGMPQMVPSTGFMGKCFGVGVVFRSSLMNVTLEEVVSKRSD